MSASVRSARSDASARPHDASHLLAAELVPSRAPQDGTSNSPRVAEATASVQRCGARAFAKVARKTSRSYLGDEKTASLEGA